MRFVQKCTPTSFAETWISPRLVSDMFRLQPVFLAKKYSHPDLPVGCFVSIFCFGYTVFRVFVKKNGDGLPKHMPSLLGEPHLTSVVKG